MVGSKVCFIDGKPFKDSYRRYKIKHGQGNNDFLSIQEVVSRRYREAGSNQELYPDVIMIDGGIGQLHAALEVFKTMDIRPPMVISLAKKEELIYVQGRPEPLRLPRNHPGLRMLQYLRDEAHRFAQHYHHLLRSKAQFAEEVKQGRRPPPPARKKKPKTDPASTAKQRMLTSPHEMPHSSHAQLPILKPKADAAASDQPEGAPLDPEDLDSGPQGDARPRDDGLAR